MIFDFKLFSKILGRSRVKVEVRDLAQDITIQYVNPNIYAQHVNPLGSTTMCRFQALHRLRNALGGAAAPFSNGSGAPSLTLTFCSP